MSRRRPADERPPNAVAPTRSAVDTTDWPAQAADTIERVVQGVREKTTGPAISAARWLVAGLFLVVVGTTVAILAAVILVRLLVVYLPDSVFGEQHVWAAHGILGLPVFVLGLALLRKRRTPADT